MTPCSSGVSSGVEAGGRANRTSLRLNVELDSHAFQALGLGINVSLSAQALGYLVRKGALLPAALGGNRTLCVHRAMHDVSVTQARRISTHLANT